MTYMNYSAEQIRGYDDAHHLHPFTDHDELHEAGVRIITGAAGNYIFRQRRQPHSRWDGRALVRQCWLWPRGTGAGSLQADARTRLLQHLLQDDAWSGGGLAKRIAEITPPGLDHVFFGASGSESNDTAIRTVRHFWALQGRPEKHIIISRKDAYHGSTIAAVSMGGMGAMQGQLGPALPGFRHVMAPYDFENAEPGESRKDFGLRAAKAIENAIIEAGPENVAAFVGEPIQGAGGVKIPPETYWPEVQRICRKYDVLLMLDEVITGFGRTGAWFACESMEIEPDTITVAKGITSGYQPLSALIVSDRIADVLSAGGEYYHGYTYSGHPVACAVAIENLDIIQREGLIDRVRDDTGPYLTQDLADVLADHPLVGEVRGFGLLAAIEIVSDRNTRERFKPDGYAAGLVRDHSINAGLMMRAVGETLILSPPLTWTRETIEEASAIVKSSLDKAAKELLD